MFNGRALILLDLQNDMVDPDGKIGKDGLAKVVAARRVLENAADNIEAARSHGDAIVFVRLGFANDYSDCLSRAKRIDALKAKRACILSALGCGFPDIIAPAAGDLVITKQCVNPFANTILMPWLSRHGITHISVGGVVTNLVVEMTARVADDAGLTVDVIEDMCAAPNDTWHQFAITQTIPLFANVIASSEFRLRGKAEA